MTAHSPPWEVAAHDTLHGGEAPAIERGPGSYEGMCPCCNATLEIAAGDNGYASLACCHLDGPCNPDKLRELLFRAHADAAARATFATTRTAVEAEALRLVPLDEFATEVEPSAETLVGSGDDAAFIAGGLAMTYGDGGEGKTTLSIDAMAHMAAGAPWLGLAVARPLRIVLIENEGPRGPFRRKLHRKIASWTGPPFEPNVRVLQDPWGEFTFAHETLRRELAAACNEFDADMLVIGPLVSLGVEGGGTPEEVSRFEKLLATFRAEVARPPCVWLTHHENKAGDVSGAWERLPDTLIHVRLEGRAQTGMHWRKARWSSALHGERWTLRWLEHCEGFERIDTERDLRAEIVALLEADLAAWRTVSEIAASHEKGGIGRNRDDVKAELDALVSEGSVMSEKGPAGRSARATCYRPALLAQDAEQVEQVDRDAPHRVLARPPDPPEGGEGEASTEGEHAPNLLDPAEQANT